MTANWPENEAENSVYCQRTKSRIKVPSPERVGMYVVVMTVTAANLPPAVHFGSRLLVCHKCSLVYFLGHVVVCRQDRQSRAIPYGGENAWLCSFKKNTIWSATSLALAKAAAMCSTRR